MTFEEVLNQALAMLQRQGRVSYRALKIRFHLDNDYIEALKDEIIKAQQLAADEGGEVLVWTGTAGTTLESTPPPISTDQHRDLQGNQTAQSESLRVAAR